MGIRTALLLGGLIVAAAPGWEGPASDPRPVLLPGGVADPAGRIGFFVGATGALEAVDLATGELLWDTTEAQRPIAVAGDMLYAQATVGKNSIRVLGFDLPSGGETVFRSEIFQFPLSVRLDDSMAIDWTLRANHLLLRWEAEASESEAAALNLTGRTKSQAAPRSLRFAFAPIERIESGPRRVGGLARIDLANGQVASEEAPPSAAAASKRPAAAAQLALRWHGEVQGKFTALVLEFHDGRQVLTRRSWDQVSGKGDEPREVFRGGRLIVLPALDHRLICLRDAATSPDQPGDRAAEWTLLNIETGTPAGRAPYVPGTHAVGIAAGRIFFLVSSGVRGPLHRPAVRAQEVRAFDLKSGKALWSRPIEGKTVRPPA